MTALFRARGARARTRCALCLTRAACGVSMATTAASRKEFQKFEREDIKYGEEIKAEAGIEFFEWLQQQEEPAAVSA